MKKLSLLLICALLLPLTVSAKKPKAKAITTNEACYIYGQSNRNSEKKGSAVSLYYGMTYSLEGATMNTSPSDIDVLLYFGKMKRPGAKKSDALDSFHLFAPNDPTLTIDWEKDGGTKPFCKYEGKSDDPDAPFALKNWEIRNATKLQRVADVNFETITAETLEALPIENAYVVYDVKVGDIILFETAATASKPGRKGLIKIYDKKEDETKPDKVGQGAYQKLLFSVKVIK